jgi:hypothetical protein
VDTPVPPTAADPRVWSDKAVKRDLRATARLHLAMIGVCLSDPQTAALVDALLARLDGEWKARQLQRTGTAGGVGT